MNEWKNLLGQIPDEKLLEISGLTPEAFAAAVAELRAALSAAEVPPAPEAPAEPASVDVAPAPAPAPPPPEPSKKRRATEAAPTPAPAPAPKPAPRVVRVTKKARIPHPTTGRTWRLGAGDVFKDETAALLWKHHPELVEPFQG